MKRDCREYRDDSPSPLLAIAGVSIFTSIVWVFCGYIIGALVGFPS